MSQSRITIRYFEVGKMKKTGIEFTTALESISDMIRVDERRRSLDGVHFRLERHEIFRDCIRGEMTRIQNDNLPAEVQDDELLELDVDELGYGVAFIYDPVLSILAMQYDPRIVAPSKLGEYLKAHDPQNEFYFRPILGEDGWGSFLEGDVTRFKVKIATPGDYDLGLDHEATASMSAIAKAFEAPYITIELGVGHKKSILHTDVKDLARRILRTQAVKTMKAKTVGSLDEVDLMEQLLHDRDSIEIPADPQESYTARSGCVYSNYITRKGFLTEYVARAD